MRTAGRVLLGSFLILAGISHFTWLRDQFPAQVPDWLPFDDDVVVLASGVVEIAVGLVLLLLVRRQVLMGWIVAGLFVAVFPANLYMAWDWRDRELSERLVAYGRLPLQIPLIWWAVALARRGGAGSAR